MIPHSQAGSSLFQCYLVHRLMNFDIMHWSGYAHSNPAPFSIMDADADLEPKPYL